MFDRLLAFINSDRQQSNSSMSLIILPIFCGIAELSYDLAIEFHRLLMIILLPSKS